MNHYRIAQSKFKIAVRIVKILRYIPGISMISVCNSLSYNRAHEGSDIDLFIIAKNGRIWTARFFTLLFLEFIGARPLVCASFFLAEDSLCIEPYKISVNDPYLEFWIRMIKPLYNETQVYERFISANSWAFSETLFARYIPNYKRRVKPVFLKLFLSLFTTWIPETFYKRLQMALLFPIIKRLALCFDSRVVISDRIIKMHTNDRRLEFKSR